MLDDFFGRILVVEDNTDIATLLVDFFSERGHIVDFAHDGLTGLHLAATEDHDAIILDLALPGIDGFELCRQLREVKKSSVPILMLTAKDSLQDKLDGFSAGADDYLLKPFELLEVEARLQALWKRTLLSNRSELKVGDLVLNLDSLDVARAGKKIPLRPVTLQILRLLMENSHRVVSRKEIESFVWGDNLIERDSLRTHISTLRAAIDKSFSIKLLHTVHGIGYRLHHQDPHAEDQSVQD
ncbi:MAG: response regulator transcription factor [Pseudomonadota bacterium]